jgi:formylglycine-generating enzyme required for sulfatase activity
MREVQESQNLHPIVYGPQDQEFILIPAGPFLMGSTEEELKYLARQWGDPTVIQKAHLNLEVPQHEVNLAAYYIGRHPVTNAEWQAFVDADGYENEAYWPDPEVLHKLRKKAPWYWPDPKWSQPNHPVVGIGWDDCVAYCKWLSGVMGRTVRLLTEAEWEKAAGWDEKRKEKRRFPWGDEWDSSRCNSLDSGNLRTTPVGQYSPAGDSPYGVADMVGSVSEYCSTLFSDAGLSHFKEYPYPYQQDDGREDITSTGYSGGSHIQRGGNWDMQWLGCRCSFRQTVKRGVVNNGIGVRVGFSAGLTDEGVSEHTGELFEEFQSDDPDVQRKAFAQLKDLASKGDRGLVSPLVEVLRQGNDSARSLAANLLGIVGNKQSVDALIKALQDSAWGVRYEAVVALGEIGDRQAIGPLKRLAAHERHQRVNGRANIVLRDIFHDVSLQAPSKGLPGIGTRPAIARTQDEVEGVNEWLTNHAVDLAALAWDSYQEKGRGMVIVLAQKAKPGEPWYTGAQFGYLDQAMMKYKTANKDDIVRVREYDPNTEFLVMVLQSGSGTVNTVRPELPPPQAYEQNKHLYKERLASM